MPSNVRFNQELPVISKSAALLERARGVIPAMTQTLAKGPGQHSAGVCPAYLVRGRGDRVWDADGNEYIDFTMGVGPISLGYCYDAVDKAILEQLGSGITFSLMHPLEVEVAELVRRVVPHAEAVRFSKTGADVTSAAVRLARAFTGKTNIVCCGYHGWHDWYISTTDRSAGIPDAAHAMTYTFAYNNISSVIEAVDADTACVILEPMVFEEPTNNFLHDLRSLCTEKGILLIFDEMWTGFRLALGGAQQCFGVRADLCTFSKAVANGMPLSILTGRMDVMRLLDHDVFFFTTFGGETLSLAAARATILELERLRVPEILHERGTRFQTDLNTVLRQRGMTYLKCIGAPCRTMLAIDPAAGPPLELKTYIQQELLRLGILWTGFHNLSYSHSEEDLEYAVRVYGEVFAKVDHIVTSGLGFGPFLKGKVLEPVFRRTTNFNTRPKGIAR